MGWYAWMPFMECYHGSSRSGHGLSGSLELDGEELNFDGGRGYIEKDWGQAFPSGYVWMHSNHFADPSVSLMASVAIIPWLRGSFQGLLIGLKHQGGCTASPPTPARRCATWASTTSTCGSSCAAVTAASWRSARTVRAGLSPARPIRTEMHKRVEETLEAQLQITLRAASGEVLLDDLGTCGGLEVHGDTSRLIHMSG